MARVFSVSIALTKPLTSSDSKSFPFIYLVSNIDLAGDSGGDQRGATLLQQVDRPFRLRCECIKSFRDPVNVFNNCQLLHFRWQRYFYILDVSAIQMRMHTTSLNRFEFLPAEVRLQY